LKLKSKHLVHSSALPCNKDLEGRWFKTRRWFSR